MTTDSPPRTMRESLKAAERLEELVPGGAHTYAKGPDQYPADMAPVIDRGEGAHVWDVDGNEYVEYGSGLRSVVLGHAHPAVVEAVSRQLHRGANFARPSRIELEAAERFLETVPTGEMVKFAKNGSDVTTAAVRLARAHTSRDLVAVCRDHPFFSTDDWFIGSTAMSAGIPEPVRRLTLTFPLDDLERTRELFEQHENRIAALVLEPEGMPDPPAYLRALIDLAHSHGTLVVFDEMITGFRWSRGGAQGLYGVVPDLSTFGKALGNGFAVSALTGRRDVMSRGGLQHPHERVFLLSTTHGAETHALAAAMAVMDVYAREDVVARLEDRGRRLTEGVTAVVQQAGLGGHILLRGRASNLVFATLDESGESSQAYRTLFMRHLLRAGVLAPSFVVSAALTDDDIERTVAAVAEAAAVYAQALDHGDPAPWLGGRPVKPVFRTFA
ncbi:glutamate-1-semialdehyde 2,1-aminomutase [Knoellia sp. 3-2P3]|uniref:glutamate-1-semialdehyde 2,1-aminomutase n=1 Tax=unclassified Knoellia TaxID=2618719 RepID=UPI0023DC9EED|nr:glutamate-1-semialdehyde 2,1-aminomutase [Knoellia sp. 3-2P3]MDF2091126.1 glutamate-1-semialdehyde 2,1-aminomutase [Knoellia sp. 3-2P3]